MGAYPSCLDESATANAAAQPRKAARAIGLGVDQRARTAAVSHSMAPRDSGPALLKSHGQN